MFSERMSVSCWMWQVQSCKNRGITRKDKCRCNRNSPFLQELSEEAVTGVKNKIAVRQRKADRNKAVCFLSGLTKGLRFAIIASV